MGKIRLKCQIADLKTEVTCYVIENETSNSPGKAAINILANGIVPSTLHQCFKYVDKNGQVQRVFAERKPGVEAYCSDASTPVSLKTQKTKPKLTLRKWKRSKRQFFHLNDVFEGKRKTVVCGFPTSSRTNK